MPLRGKNTGLSEDPPHKKEMRIKSSGLPPHSKTPRRGPSKVSISSKRFAVAVACRKRPPSLSSPAAINNDVSPGNESGGLRAQVNRECAYLFHFSPASQWNS